MPALHGKKWQRIKIKDTTRGPAIWEVKAARVHLVDALEPRRSSIPTDRLYRLIVARNPRTDEIKYFVSNAPAKIPLKKMMSVGFARWHVENWQASLLVVRACETGRGVWRLRSTHLHESDSALALFAYGNVFLGRTNPAASGGKIRGSPWSKLRT